MTCKDCMHFLVCEKAYHLFDEQDVEKRCKHYKNNADYAEVKHGEWVPIVMQDDYLEPPYCDTIKCSECGQVTDVSFHDVKYCYECGAKMDGERKHA